MALFYLIRHGDNDSVGQGISGRSRGLHLNADGRAQAQALAEHLAHSGIERILCSPLERAMETAQPLAQRLGVELEILEAFHEVEFGQWTGATFAELDKQPHWKRFNRVRTVTRIPGGELMLEIQARMVVALERLRHENPEGRLAVVSHGDPIRVALAYYIGIPLDLMQNIHVDLASVSVVAVDDHGARLRCLNHTGAVPTA